MNKPIHLGAIILTIFLTLNLIYSEETKSSPLHDTSIKSVETATNYLGLGHSEMWTALFVPRDVYFFDIPQPQILAFKGFCLDYVFSDNSISINIESISFFLFDISAVVIAKHYFMPMNSYGVFPYIGLGGGYWLIYFGGNLLYLTGLSSSLGLDVNLFIFMSKIFYPDKFPSNTNLCFGNGFHTGVEIYLNYFAFLGTGYWKEKISSPMWINKFYPVLGFYVKYFF